MGFLDFLFRRKKPKTTPVPQKDVEKDYKIIKLKKVLLSDVVTENNQLSTLINSLNEQLDSVNSKYVNLKQNAIHRFGQKKFDQGLKRLFLKGDNIGFVITFLGQPKMIEIRDDNHKLYFYKEQEDNEISNNEVFEFDAFGNLSNDVSIKPGWGINTVFEILELQLQELKQTVQENFKSLELKQSLIDMLTNEIKELNEK